MSYTVEQIGAERFAQVQEALAEVLWACVQDHASVGFILPFMRNEALAFFTGTIAPAVASGGRVLFVARDSSRVLGTVQLVVDTPANQPHRAEISKLLVHPKARRRGVARALMAAAEAEARTRGKGLLTLDTRTGDSAEPLYASLGFQVAGVIPGYCRAPESERLDGTTYMYKAL
ncbi:GNAT family N-acetyltransferase [Pseudoruegeria sp. SHC-113]|uniref:GNAT family N-acetyltransferase n=1 Tax=Pseudoruegeria sp. SHC-113 TaxID=2855439 RepID=UPI0021BB403E|nr:GNAT family N-acetyltransferase [Pseudoruegeria sp. SHC-113]MCT8161586.1 GNAT family N-acetyltransferase [Pseudoruegeria sp. SHC-113]